jgi:hypothetical protein
MVLPGCGRPQRFFRRKQNAQALLPKIDFLPQGTHDPIKAAPKERRVNAWHIRVDAPPVTLERIFGSAAFLITRWSCGADEADQEEV